MSPPPVPFYPMPNSSMPWLQENFSFSDYDFNHSRSNSGLSAEIIINLTLGIVMVLLNTVTVLQSSRHQQSRPTDLYGAILIVRCLEERQAPSQVTRPSNRSQIADAASSPSTSPQMRAILPPQDTSSSPGPMLALPAPVPVAASRQHHSPPPRALDLRPQMASQGYSSSWTMQPPYGTMSQLSLPNTATAIPRRQPMRSW